VGQAYRKGSEDSYTEEVLECVYCVSKKGWEEAVTTNQRLAAHIQKLALTLQRAIFCICAARLNFNLYIQATYPHDLNSYEKFLIFTSCVRGTFGKFVFIYNEMHHATKN
jgi:hypothetical protein